MFVRSPMYRRHAGLAALSAGLSAALLVTGCGSLTDQGQSGSTPSQEVRLLSAAEPGPDPFTPSTATATAVSRQLPAPRVSTSASASASGGKDTSVRSIRTVLGSAPGLYGGTRSVASCDVEQQIRLLVADQGKAQAFTEGVGVGQHDMPGFLRGLTPVMLRADARLTNHGYRDGIAQRHQVVLQAGTAVLVDEHGSPRVRCASGSPLASPVVTAGPVNEQGKPWQGYDRDRVVVITRAAHVIDNLVLVDMAAGTWMERRSGSDGEADQNPQVPPAYDPGLHVVDAPQVPLPAAPGSPSEPPPPSPDAPAPQPASPEAIRPGTPSAPPRGPDGPPPILPDAPLPDGVGQGTGGPDVGVPGAFDRQGAGQSDSDILISPDSGGGAGQGAGTAGGGNPDGAPDVILPDAPLPDAPLPGGAGAGPGTGGATGTGLPAAGGGGSVQG
ncbi:hypothetical protein E3E14_31315 [Streptomyces sp. ICN441]|uniref:DUF6777 domain-containing protein n=1 Tax=Streptomyces sp. ICN441 TaxID=2558286 RepID=UPI00106B59B3|nr:DUF6777 domain-containing protein [Streptomyces sp. ICN441]TFE36279.1 hypothetical protein E3E14_31315 [Streptomyces sp. ICN441]